MKIFIGVIIAVVGWLMLVVFSGAETGYGGNVINLHSVAIANNVILLGYFMIILGTLQETADQISKHIKKLSVDTNPKAQPSDKTPKNNERVEPVLSSGHKSSAQKPSDDALDVTLGNLKI